MSKKLTETEKSINKANATMKRKAKSALSQITKDLNAERFTSSIVQQLDKLSERRKVWEATDYKKANEGLYALLAEGLDLFQTRFVKGNPSDQKALRASLIQRLTADGIRVVKTSTTLTMLARYIFNSDRKRAQGYGYVLAAAVSHGIEAKDFANWVTQQGGIEQIKRLMVKKPEAIAKQAAVATATVAVSAELEQNTLQPLAHVDIAGLTGDYAVLLAKPNVAGGADVVGTLNEVNKSLLDALVLRMAKEMATKQQADAELGRQVAKEHGDMLAASNDELERMVANG